MHRCKRCSSYAINHNMYGRGGSELDLCDVCYWRGKYEAVSDCVRGKGDYIRRLIAGVRKQIDADPELILARAELGEEALSARWLDAELLRSVIEKEVLGETELD